MTSPFVEACSSPKSNCVNKQTKLEGHEDHEAGWEGMWYGFIKYLGRQMKKKYITGNSQRIKANIK